MAQKSRRRTVVAAGAEVPNIVPADQLIAPGFVSVSIFAANETAEAIRMSVFGGGELVLTESEVPLEQAAGRGPIPPDNLMVNFGLSPGESLTISVRNTDGAAARDIVVEIQIDPIPAEQLAALGII